MEFDWYEKWKAVVRSLENGSNRGMTDTTALNPVISPEVGGSPIHLNVVTVL